MKARLLLAAALALTAWAGCTLTKTDLRQRANGLMPTLGEGGRLIVPKQCALKMAVLTRPVGDPAFDEALWSVADSQAVGDEARRLLEINGLQVGRITGELPGPVREILDAPPPRQVNPAVVVLPDHDTTQVDLGAESPELDLLMARAGGVAGKRYKDARGYLRLSAWRQGEEGVALRITPELHHGPVRQGWGPAPGAGSFTPQQLVMHNGQQEETLRELAATVTLHAGQLAVISCRPDAKGSSLGGFLFHATEANSDRPVQKVVLVWASRSEDGAPDPLDFPGLQPVDPPDLSEAPPRRASARAMADAR
jgi:hypothetical protein